MNPARTFPFRTCRSARSANEARTRRTPASASATKSSTSRAHSNSIRCSTSWRFRIAPRFAAASAHFLRKVRRRGGDLLTPIAEAELLLPCAIGGLHRLLRVHSPRDECRQHVSTGQSAAAQLQMGADRVPRPAHLPSFPSGTPIRRPYGQTAEHPGGPPKFGRSRRLDYELEIGAFLGPGNAIGSTIPIAEAEDHLVGVCLLNDWSARDIQTWEYQPLGPFLSKNFATTISPWIVTREALEPFRTEATPHDETLPYLVQQGTGAFKITLEVWLNGSRISHSNFSWMYWTLGQMIAHHASNGCPLRAGDLIGTGTVSGPEKENRGCLLELTWRGADPLTLPSGQTRTFLEDGDEVTLRGYCEGPGAARIGLGSCTGTIQSADGISASR